MQFSTFNKNLDTYLHRTYRKHLKSNKKGDPTFQTGLRKLTLIGDEFRPRGLEEKISYTTFFDKEGKIKQEYLDDGFELLKDLRETKKIAPTTWDREFKKILAELVISKIEPISKKMNDLLHIF